MESWRELFNTGTNWKDFAVDLFYSNYKSMTYEQHLGKAKSMLVRFLKAYGKGFFVEKAGFDLAIREEMEDVIGDAVLGRQMKDIL